MNITALKKQKENKPQGYLKFALQQCEAAAEQNENSSKSH